MAALVWLRDDLRCADNPALAAAVAEGGPVAALFCLDEVSPDLRPPGGAARWWLHGALHHLSADLAKLNIPLILRRGAAAEIVPAVAAAVGAGSVHWNRRYDAGGVAVDKTVAAALGAAKPKVAAYQANLLFEPTAIRTKLGGPFRVFTPFWRACADEPPRRRPLPAPPPAAPFTAAPPPSDRLADWALRPTNPDWAGGLAATWTPGEAGAEARLAAFLAGALAGYAEGRDRPAGITTSRLSPHLRFGEISPFRVWHAIRDAAASGHPASATDVDKVLAEIGWREFSWHLLHQAPDLTNANFNPSFNAFPWRDDPAGLTAWRRGRTGIPIVDAGMRQLWLTGWMHNRVRMIVASFLTKHLLIPWQFGERWFWDTLVDADAASNPAGWQWVAGSGADAAPYFRIFNPVSQGEKFDPDGAYIRAYVPELAHLAAGDIHQPWRLARPPRDYPAPIVDLARGRARALSAYAMLKTPG